MSKARNIIDTTVSRDSFFLSEPLKGQHATITLLPVEQLLRQLLLDYRDEVLLKDPISELNIWFTGGWVRDKLLGIKTMDIDAVLSTMTGVQFGEGLECFYSTNGHKYTQEADKLRVSSSFKLYKIDKKPEKSKHLETGTAHIFGLDIDFVNLRGETYTEGNRNPQMRFATVEEDAFRRDATINAIYYNIEKQQVEDWTGKGLEDIAAGIIRTPLEAYQTFMDDPLRVLRLIRFASRLGYAIANNAKQSMKDERIHIALNAKVSRERDNTILAELVLPLEKSESVWVIAAYAPIACLRRRNLKQAVKDATDAMKLTHNNSKLLEDSLKHMEDIQSKVDLAAAHDYSKGIIILGGKLAAQVLFSLVGEVVCEGIDDRFLESQLVRYSKLLDYVHRQNLQDAHLVKLILNGDDVKELFHLSRMGPFIKTAINGIARWQFDNEDGSRDDAIDWLRGQKEVLGIP